MKQIHRAAVFSFMHALRKKEKTFKMKGFLGDRLVVGQRTLTPSTVVRIHVPQPIHISRLQEFLPLSLLKPQNDCKLQTLIYYHGNKFSVIRNGN